MNSNAQNQSGTGKIFVAYFSWSGNTRALAEQIRGKTGSGLFEIKTVTAYSSNYNTVLDQARNEKRNNARPALAAHVEMAQYDTVYIGFPNWWGDMPMAVYTFIEEYDFSGKKIILFCTHGGSGFSGTIKTLRNKLNKSNLPEGFAVNGRASQSDVNAWIDTVIK
jgi:flavodoxin